jgi:UDP-N-acetylglucosamine 4-epimerase
VLSPNYRRLREQLAAEPKRWLITGVAGFIGSNLLEDLLSLGQTVVGLDNFSTGHRSNITDVLATQSAHTSRFSLIEGDIRSLDTCRAAVAGVDYVLHHAALGSVPRSIDDPLTTHAVNVDGFVNMLLASKEAGVARFVYASSSAVYGDSANQPQVEERVGRPLSPYAASKAINEAYAIAFEMTYGIRTVGLRYFNIFGPRQDPQGAYAAVIPRWISNLLLGEPCQIYGDGETTRDFCHVSNVVEANLLAATVTNEAAIAECYNVACSQTLTLNQLFLVMRQELARELPSVAMAEPSYEAFRAGDIRFSSGSIEKARRILGFSPTHSVAEGMTEALAWYVEQSRTAGALEPEYAR